MTKTKAEMLEVKASSPSSSLHPYRLNCKHQNQQQSIRMTAEGEYGPPVKKHIK